MVYQMSDDEIFSELYNMFCEDDLTQNLAIASSNFYEGPKNKIEFGNSNVFYPNTIEEHIEQMNNFKIKQVESIMDTLNFETLKKLSKIIDRAERWSLSSGCN
jgi:hypothetical protein